MLFNNATAVSATTTFNLFFISNKNTVAKAWKKKSVVNFPGNIYT